MALGETSSEVRSVERYIREPLLYKGNAAVVVAYTDHGTDAATPFPGVEQTSTDLKQGFSGQKVHALVADSQLRLDETGAHPQGLLKEHVDRAQDFQIQDIDLTFQEWVVRQSVQNGTSLLFFDVGAVPEMVDASYSEYKEKKGSSEDTHILSFLDFLRMTPIEQHNEVLKGQKKPEDAHRCYVSLRSGRLQSQAC